MAYHDLDIFLESKRLALEVHKMTLGLPRLEMFEEGSQVRRSSKAICSLIVEGYGRRRYKADFIKYLIHAHAECDETIIHLDFLFETSSWPDEEAHFMLVENYKSLSKNINRFIQWADKKMNSFE
jgi:four helix bundle protein